MDSSEMEFGEYTDLTDIQKFFYGQSVLITGVTGLLGKVVLEKLLRSCPGIGMVYILMRPKKELTAQQRSEKMFKLELFRELKAIFPEFLERVKVVDGDITMDRLGISFEDYEKIVQNVSIVIHSAASISFNSPLKKAVDNNLKPTKVILDMCHEMPKIRVLVHVSSICVKRENDGSVLEKIPATKITAEQLMDALEWMDESCQNVITEQLIEKSPLYTYPLTKALSEAHIGQNRGDLPVAIVRPSYICSTYKEPFPGWIDTVQGVSGLFLAGAKGVLRAVLATRNYKIDMIPVDVVSNAIITTAWHVGVTRPPSVFVINTVLDNEKMPLADKDILPFALNKREEFPLSNTYRYPNFVIYYNSFAYKLHVLIDQWIPALFVDLLLYLFTGRTILLKLYSKITFLIDAFYRVSLQSWNPRRENFNFLKNIQSERDAKVFCIDADNLDWWEYIDTFMMGARKFLAHEDPSNIPYAKKKAVIWSTSTTIIQRMLLLGLLYYLYLLVSQFYL